jgi:hypothetical protein
LLGGTNDEGNWDTEPSAEVAERIMAGCVAIEPRLRGAEILGHRVGLRPCRPEVRLESEPLGDGLLWHNYGHGGAGISMSWGCAAEITRAVQSLRCRGESACGRGRRGGSRCGGGRARGLRHARQRRDHGGLGAGRRRPHHLPLGGAAR